jgi:AAA+ superfamily predicted ATPase
MHHAKSYAVRQIISEVIPEIIEPLEKTLWSAWEPGEDAVDGLGTLRASFVLFGLQLAYADGEISNEEAGLLYDIEELFDENITHLSNIQLRDIYRDTVVKNTELFYGQIRLPTTIHYLQIFDDTHHTDYANKAKEMFLCFAQVMLEVNGKMTNKKKQIFCELLDIFDLNSPATAIESNSNSIDISELNLNNQTDNGESKSLEDLINELNNLIGLDAVKNDVMQLVNFLRVQQMRQASGMASVPISRHLVFYGNPGTGKTTVARLLAQIYRTMGVITKGHLVETDRSGLVAGYVGQTALKVKEVVTQALGGVLFIDEAYALVSEGQDYGQEAIDTLIKLMEDNREDLIVVVAGYTDKMSRLLTSNPGLRSRFNKYFNFDDYSPTQLTSIFELFCKTSGIQMTTDARDKALGIFKIFHEVRDETFGNARLARNLFEQTVNHQANRIISLSNITDSLLSTIEAIDIPSDVSASPAPKEQISNLPIKTDETLQPIVITDGRIKFSCSNCSQILNIALEYAGKRGKCPACGNVMTSPSSA